MLKRLLTVLLLGVLTAALGLTAQGTRLAHASTANIDTIALWDGNADVSPFGVPNLATFGQTITAPAAPNNRLTDFSFEMNLPSTLVFRGEVYAWDSGTNRATGASLYESAPTSTSGSGGFEKITFTIPAGGVTLTPGASYVLFASVSKDFSASSGTGLWGQTANTDTYSGGQVVASLSGNDPSQWTSSSWLGLPNTDMAFQANFGLSVNCADALPGPVFFTPVLSNGGNTVTIGQKDANGYSANAYTTTNIGSATNTATPDLNSPFNNVFTKAVAGTRATVKIVATDDAGCSATFDPTFTSSVRSDGAPVTDTYSGILASENTVSVTNGTPGVTNLTIAVNGQSFSLHGLKAGENRSVNIGSALSGDNNTVTVSSTGKPGGSAFLLIGPGQ